MPVSAWQDYQYLKALDEAYEASRRHEQCEEEAARARQLAAALLLQQQQPPQPQTPERCVSPLTAYMQGKIPLSALSVHDVVSSGLIGGGGTGDFSSPIPKAGEQAYAAIAFAKSGVTASAGSALRTATAPTANATDAPSVDVAAVGSSAAQRLCDHVESIYSASSFHYSCKKGDRNHTTKNFPYEDRHVHSTSHSSRKPTCRRTISVPRGSRHSRERDDCAHEPSPHSTPAPPPVRESVDENGQGRLLFTGADNDEVPPADRPDTADPLPPPAGGELMPYRNPASGWGVPWDALPAVQLPSQQQHQPAAVVSLAAGQAEDDVDTLLQWAEALDTAWVDEV